MAVSLADREVCCEGIWKIKKGERIMIRKIIKIDEEKCNGCGACAAACHEGAIEMIDGKAKLTREDYCDGLGDCLPACPADAIGFEEREAPAYDEAAVLAAKKKTSFEPLPCGCPGMQSKSIQRERNACSEPVVSVHSQLSQWPVQIKLAPVNAPYLRMRTFWWQRTVRLMLMEIFIMSLSETMLR